MISIYYGNGVLVGVKDNARIEAVSQWVRHFFSGRQHHPSHGVD